MRRMLTLGVLTLAMMGTAGLPTCDSGCVAMAEDGRPALDSDRPQVAPAQDGKTARGRPMREPVDYIYPAPLDERQRGPLRGDFWTPKDRDRAFQDFDRFQSFEPAVPPGR